MTARMMMLKGVKLRVGHFEHSLHLGRDPVWDDTSHIFIDLMKDIWLIPAFLRHHHIGIIMAVCDGSGV